MYGTLSYLWDLGFGAVERWGGAIKSPFRVTMQATCRGADNFNGERGEGSLCNNAALKLYCKSYWVLYKIL